MYGNNDIVKHNCFLFSLLFFCSCSWTAEQCKALFMPLSVVIRTRILVFLFFFYLPTILFSFFCYARCYKISELLDLFQLLVVCFLFLSVHFGSFGQKLLLNMHFFFSMHPFSLQYALLRPGFARELHGSFFLSGFIDDFSCSLPTPYVLVFFSSFSCDVILRSPMKLTSDILFPKRPKARVS